MKKIFLGGVSDQLCPMLWIGQKDEDQELTPGFYSMDITGDPDRSCGAVSMEDWIGSKRGNAKRGSRDSCLFTHFFKVFLKGSGTMEWLSESDEENHYGLNELCSSQIHGLRP